MYVYVCACVRAHVCTSEDKTDYSRAHCVWGLTCYPWPQAFPPVCFTNTHTHAHTHLHTRKAYSMCVYISHCKLLWIRTAKNQLNAWKCKCVCVCVWEWVCVVMTGVALTGPICHPRDLWWIDNEQKHKHKRLKMNSCRLKATFSAWRNVERQQPVWLAEAQVQGRQ